MNHTTAYIYSRISSKHQTTGHGLDRQQELALEYANRLNFNISTETFNDIASGYHGKQMAGKLGLLIEAVNTGRIQPPAVLIVESLDRLGREHEVEALSRLLDLINAGIDVHEVSTETVYNKARPELLHLALAVMSRAHNESKLKSQRSRDALDRVFHKAERKEGIISRNVPSWIIINTDTTTPATAFSLNKTFASTIQYIFNLYLSGMGSNRIAQKLHEEQHELVLSKPHQAKRMKQTWTDSRVLNILQAEAVTGTFTSKSASRQHIIINDYYPQVISIEQFNQAQAIRTNKKRTNAQASNNGTVKNILSGLIRCECGMKWQYNKSAWTTKQGKQIREYLRCGSYKASPNCGSQSLQLRQLEHLILTWFSSINLNNTVSNTNEHRAKLQQLEQQAENLLDLVMMGDARANTRYQALMNDINETTSLIANETEQQTVIRNAESFNVFDVLDVKNNELRRKVQILLVATVNRITIKVEGKDVTLRIYMNNHQLSDDGFAQQFKGVVNDMAKAHQTHCMPRVAIG
ncbi:recombinase family protein [Psychromonas aquimarina]|uniref:recombinase family protein n=1 Tax=Psychromonas aquimarina TaxID=444919 RepID=UPI00041411DF|nr:recombinase family protein [Psychromonas aquimarina]